MEEQQNLRCPNGIGEQVEQRLRFLINPVQILEDDHQRLVERFAREQALDRLMRTAPAYLRVHLREWTIALNHAKQCKNVWDCVFERAIQGEDFAVDLLAPLALVVLGEDFEVAI